MADLQIVNAYIYKKKKRDYNISFIKLYINILSFYNAGYKIGESYLGYNKTLQKKAEISTMNI